MSRTDRTKPLWVRYVEHNPRPVHDHRHGACDLPPAPTRERTHTRCRWEPGMLLADPRCCAACGMRSCGKEWQRMTKAANRRRRYEGRREARRRAAEADRD